MTTKKQRNAVAISNTKPAMRNPDDFKFMKKVVDWVKNRGWDGRGTQQCSKAVMSAARHWGVSTDVIYRYIRVSEHACGKVKGALQFKEISFGSAYELSKLSISMQEDYLRIAKRVSTRQLKKAITENLSDSYIPASESQWEDPNLKSLLDEISSLIGHEVIAYESGNVTILRISYTGIGTAISFLTRFQAEDTDAIVDMVTDNFDIKLQSHLGKIYMRFSTAQKFKKHLNMVVGNRLKGNPDTNQRT